MAFSLAVQRQFSLSASPGLDAIALTFPPGHVILNPELKAASQAFEVIAASQSPSPEIPESPPPVESPVDDGTPRLGGIAFTVGMDGRDISDFKVSETAAARRHGASQAPNPNSNPNANPKPNPNPSPSPKP